MNEIDNNDNNNNSTVRDHEALNGGAFGGAGRLVARGPDHEETIEPNEITYNAALRTPSPARWPASVWMLDQMAAWLRVCVCVCVCV